MEILYEINCLLLAGDMGESRFPPPGGMPGISAGQRLPGGPGQNPRPSPVQVNLLTCLLNLDRVFFIITVSMY